jgi:porin
MLTKQILLGAVSLAALASPAHAQTIGQKLYNEGTTITLNYTGEAAANPSGGIRQGSQYAGQIYLGGDFDLAKIANWQGATLHIAVTQRHGRNLAADDIGNNTSVQEVYGTQNVHVAVFTLEQKLFDDRLDITIGRTVANIAFLNNPLYCDFQSNSACGNPTFIFKDSNFTYFPASAWGGDARFLFTPNTYLHAGAYEVNPADKTLQAHGLSYLDGQHSTGLIIPAELGQTTNTHLYAIGGWYDTGAYADPLNDATGQPALLANQPYAQHHDRSGMFLRFTQNVNDTGLAVFGVFMTKLSGQVNENQYYELGAVQTGTFPGRAQDTIGAVINDQEFSNDFLHNIEYAREAAGGTGNIPHREIMMELNYGAQVTPAIRIMPNIQYVLNPDQSAEPARTKNIPNAFVIGFKFTVDLAQLAGLSASTQ